MVGKLGEGQPTKKLDLRHLTRRDFLRLVGIGAATAAVGGCVMSASKAPESTATVPATGTGTATKTATLTPDVGATVQAVRQPLENTQQALVNQNETQAQELTRLAQVATPENSATPKQVNSATPENSATPKQVNSATPENSATPKQVNSATPENSATPKQVNSATPENSATPKQVNSATPEKTPFPEVKLPWEDGKYQTFPRQVMNLTVNPFTGEVLQNPVQIPVEQLIDVGTLGPDVDTICGIDFKGDLQTGALEIFRAAGEITETRVVFTKRADLKTVQLQPALGGDRFDIFRISEHGGDAALDVLARKHAVNTARLHQKVIFVGDLGLFEQQWGEKEKGFLNAIIRAQRPAKPEIGIPAPDFVSPRTY